MLKEELQVDKKIIFTFYPSLDIINKEMIRGGIGLKI